MLIVLLMAKRFLLILCLLALAGCGAGISSSGSPWERNTSQTAVSGPKVLNRAAVQHPPAPPQGTAAALPPGVEVYGLEDQNAFPAGEAAMPPQESKQAPAATGALQPVKVGLLVPLSGPNAELGQALLQSAQLALFDMGYDSFELLPRDTNEGAASAAQSAAEAGAQLFLGPLFAPDVRAAQPVAHRHNLSMIAFSTDWTLADSNTYVMGFLPFVQVQRVVEYAAENGYRNIGVLVPKNEYGDAVMAAWRDAASRTGVNTAENARFTAGQVDLTPVVAAFAHQDAKAPVDAVPPYDAVFLPVGGEQARAVGKLLTYYKLPAGAVRRLGTGLWDDTALASEPSLAGGWFAAPAPELRRGFERRYIDTYGQEPPRIASLAYDATALAAVLARNGYASTGRPAFDRAALTNPNGFAGIDGIFRFRPNGLVERGLAVMELRQGRIVQVDPAPKTFQSYAGQ